MPGIGVSLQRSDEIQPGLLGPTQRKRERPEPLPYDLSIVFARSAPAWTAVLP